MYDLLIKRAQKQRNKRGKMNIKNKIYQMFIAGLEGEELKGSPNLKKALNEGLGGVIFFTRNIKTEEQFKKLIRDIKEESTIAPFLSIDQEGGRVERTENIHNGKKYLSAKFTAEKGELFLKNQTTEIAKELKGYGINLNFAPCLDVNTNPNNPIIGERAFSDNPDDVIKFGKIAVETYLENGIIPCTKHFPGHGDASVDSHKALPKIDLSLEDMEKFHIEPFKKVQAPMVMIAHLHCICFDREEIPSSLSKNVISYLRNNIGYKGLIITDDMVMGGVLGVDGTEACVKAIKAGVNILLYRDTDDETIKIIEDLAKISKNDTELKSKIEESYDKIVGFKREFLK